VSGLVTEADWTGWRPEAIGRFVDRALDVFGPGRLLFGSDWPVCLLAASYQAVHELARELLGGLGEAERAAIFGNNAVAVYRLDAEPRPPGFS
jgi:L-fuconolactonase